MDEKKITYQGIIALTLPTIVSVALEPMAEMIDTAVLGHSNTVWVGSLAATNACLGSFAWLFNFLSYGVTAQVAQSLGAGRRDAIGAHILTALLMALVIGLGMGALLILLEQQLLGRVMGASGELLEESRVYYSIRVIGYPLTILSISLIGILRGLQKISLTMTIVIVTTLVNAVGSYLAVFHYGWGIHGAAWATVLSFLAGDSIALSWLWRHRREFGLEGRWNLEWKDVMDLGADGVNLAGRTGALTLSFFIVTALATRLGTTVVAAYQVALQAWLLAAYCMDGLAITATSLGGQLLGQGERAAHHLLSRRLVHLGLLVGGCFFLFYWIAETWVQGLFTNRPEVMVLLSGIWFWLSISQPINAVAYVYDGILFGAKDFVFLRKRMMEGFALVFLPLALWGFLKMESLLGLWLALIGLNIYRMISGWWGSRRI
ncbi:MAG: MATE family efflux transporter [Chlamydiia bacterium]|nr:MATE family efflux transporter [Chlamydiia bacterium]